ncbi:MAG: SdpI family protein [bacterium]|nr:SdpI family protein [bacterium]
MRFDWVSAGLILIALVATVAVYPRLPETIPRHWNVHGEVDAWGPRASIFGMIAVTVALYGLFLLLPRLDRRLAARPGAYPVLVRAFVIMFLVIHGGTVAAARGYPLRMLQWTGVTLGLLMVYVGNQLPRLRPNYVAGIRTPWTLGDEAVWRATHRAGGYLATAGGLGLVAASLVLSEPGVVVAILGFLLVMIGFSIAYPYSLCRRRR